MNQPTFGAAGAEKEGNESSEKKTDQKLKLAQELRKR